MRNGREWREKREEELAEEMEGGDGRGRREGERDYYGKIRKGKSGTPELRDVGNRKEGK